MKDYLTLMRPFKAIFFAEVIIGYLLASSFSLSLILLPIFISFSLLYSGIYAFNDVFDYKEDRKHKKKKLRPIPSGKISLINAALFASFLVLTGLISGYFISKTVFCFELIFLAFNLLYSSALKKIPYIDSISNSVTHPLRFAFGYAIFGAAINLSFIFALFLAGAGFSFLKRYKELLLKEKGRTALKNCSKKIIPMAIIVIAALLALLAFSKLSALALLVMLIYILVILLYFTSVRFRRIMNKIFDY